MGQKKALITGITGQDGSYLAELLLEKGYAVHGLKRRSSSLNTQRIDHIYETNFKSNQSFFLHYGDLTDGGSILNLLNKVKPDEVYNLGAQSHVAVSFEIPEHTTDVIAMGTLRLLEGLRTLGMEKHVKFYQASSSELFGLVQQTPQNENTPFYPRSPYAIAKLHAYWTVVNYREAYGMFACNGILFNHESPRRGETFVTKKITQGLCEVATGRASRLYLGNLDALRDWGYAKDYVKMQWLMLQQDTPTDYVIATGKQHSVREFLLWALEFLGVTVEFSGSGTKEVATVTSITGVKAGKISVGQIIMEVSDVYFRPTEVDTLLGDASKAHKELGWRSATTARDLCHILMKYDYEAVNPKDSTSSLQGRLGP